MNKTPITMAESIDWLFTRLAGTYGAQWTRQWEGTPMTDVKAAWGHELSAYAGNPSAIKHALDNLPERCPNVIQFRNLCRTAPARTVPQIEAPKADPARIREELAKLAPAPERVDGREWARRIVARHAQGERLGVFALNLAQSALRDRMGAAL